MLETTSDTFQDIPSKKLKPNESTNFVSCFSTNTFLSNNSDKFQFPWSINAIDLTAYDFFRVIELFIKATCLTNAAQTSESVLITRDMVKHLNKIEESILETVGWSVDSNLWKEINQLKMNPDYSKAETNHTSENGSNLQYKIPFPLFEDVNNLPAPTTGIISFHLNADLKIWT